MTIIVNSPNSKFRNRTLRMLLDKSEFKKSKQEQSQEIKYQRNNLIKLALVSTPSSKFSALISYSEITPKVLTSVTKEVNVNIQLMISDYPDGFISNVIILN